MMQKGSKRPLSLMLSVLLSSVLLVACNDSTSVPDKVKDSSADTVESVTDKPVAENPVTDESGAPAVTVGGDTDKHGCKASAGYSWCATTNQCERPWELAKKASFDNTEEAFAAFCAGTEK